MLRGCSIHRLATRRRGRGRGRQEGGGTRALCLAGVLLSLLAGPPARAAAGARRRSATARGAAGAQAAAPVDRVRLAAGLQQVWEQDPDYGSPLQPINDAWRDVLEHEPDDVLAHRRLAINLSRKIAAQANDIHDPGAHLLAEATRHMDVSLQRSPNDMELLLLAIHNMGMVGRDETAPARRRSLCSRARAATDRADVGVPGLRDMYLACCARSDGACFDEAVARGAWQSRWQHPQVYNEDFRAQLWWTSAELGKEVEALTAALQQQWTGIRDEALAALEHSAALFEQSDFIDSEAEGGTFGRGDWSELKLWYEGSRMPGCAAMPVACQLVGRARVREITSTVVGGVTVSRMGPGTAVNLHSAGENARVRVHLPLVIPKGDLGIRVAGESAQWVEGELMAFDDRYVAPFETCLGEPMVV